MKLEGRAALVTGAGKRVGRALALALARRGMAVAVHYNRSREEAEDLARGLTASYGVKAAALRAELADPKACRKLVADAARALGRLDALINSASIYERTPFERVTLDDWDRHMDINLRAPFLLSQAAAPHLKKRGGAIINIADWAAHRPYADYIPYCVSKAGLLCLNTALAKQLAPEIRVNSIMPGPVMMPEGETKAQREAVRRATLLQKLGGPEDIVKAVLFLLDSDFMTGASIAVDGGRLIA
jgi:NAD(P)-dependent dehydrogenase (short-subunit alcohol dehydrogenase family)